MARPTVKEVLTKNANITMAMWALKVWLGESGIRYSIVENNKAK